MKQSAHAIYGYRFTEAAGMSLYRDAADTVTVDLAAAGIGQPAKARDLWKREEIGEVSGSISFKLPAHGSALVELTL